MEYNSLTELYNALIPAFNVKKRLLSITMYKELESEAIWSYLAITKWKMSKMLTIFDMVNDIIMIDASNIINYKGEE